MELALIVQEISPGTFTEINRDIAIKANGVLHPWQIVELWSDTELAAIGIYRVQPTLIPAGKSLRGYTFARVAGVVKQMLTLADLPAAPPPSATPRQIRLALTQIGVRQQIEEWVNTQPLDVQDNWHYASVFLRDNVLINEAATVLGKTSADIDALFALARTYT